MRLGAIALKLRAANTAKYGTKIYGSAELAAAIEYSMHDEAAFVIPVSEVAIENDQDSEIIQKVVETFGVVCAIKNDLAMTEKLGLTAFDQLHAIREDIFGALIGWIIPGAEDKTSYVGGTVIDLRADYLWYQFNFRTAFILQEVDTITAGLDDFLRIYTEWMHDDVSRRILPLTGDAPLLPNRLQAPDFTTLIDYKYPFSKHFGSGFHTLESDFTNDQKNRPEEGA